VSVGNRESPPGLILVDRLDKVKASSHCGVMYL